MDKEPLSRAFLNVFSNAVDFTPPGGTIEFTAALQGRAVEFRVSDSGTGFSKKALINAAKQFYMEDESRSSNLHYGMGLFIVDTIIKKHNGELLLSNAEQLRGAQVAIVMPVSAGGEEKRFRKIYKI